jgi:hypothetical protein
MGVKEKEAILAAAKALNGEDVLTPKKRGQPSIEEKQVLHQRKRNVQQKRQQRRQQKR